MKRRTKITQAAMTKSADRAGGLHLGETRGLVTPIHSKTATVTLRLSGPWYTLWERLKISVPDVGDAELLRQGVALRMALAALDAKGEKPKALIRFHNEAGELVTADLEEHVGIARLKRQS